MENLVSIIVPVYNAEVYLKSCIESILSLTYKNIEIILVNDGSTDDSQIICKEYEEKYSCIKVINQKNSGPSVARNTGINASTGDFIQFVDSDDKVDPNMTGDLMKLMKLNIELAICGYKSINMNKGKVNEKLNLPSIEGIFPNKYFMEYFGDFYSNSLINSPWNKLYNTNLIKSFNIRFTGNVKNGEDLLFNLEYLGLCKNIGVTKKPLYIYMKNNNINSLTKNYRENFFENRKIVFSKVKEFLIDKDAYSFKNKNIIDSFYTKYIISSIENLFHKNSNLNSKSRKVLINNIISDNWVIENFDCFKMNNLQTYFIRMLIRYRMVNELYIFFKMKTYIKTFFVFLKNINHK